MVPRNSITVISLPLLDNVSYMKREYPLLRGTILNRTYGTYKHLYISLFLLTRFGPIYSRAPVIVPQ